uniref:glucan endo-1,3-beta-D-glucosidase n=1 Tax=Euglena gracilis TaxID=3039 RepID=A0A8D4WX44_EUGGR|nr:beta-1,3-glucanase [Euglena gracilis]
MVYVGPRHIPLLLLLLGVLAPAVAQPTHVPGPISVQPPAELGFFSLGRPEEGTTAPIKSRFCLAESHGALPTNAWWVPAVLHTSTLGANYITQLPYVFTLEAAQLRVYYPHLEATSDEVSHTYPTSPWSLSALAPLPTAHCVVKADPFTVTFAWTTNGAKVMQSTLVRGSPFVTMYYTSAAPVLSTEQNVSTLAVDGVEHACNGQGLAGAQLTLQFEESDEEWTVFLPPNTPVRCISGNSRTVVEVLETSFTGNVRLALSNNCTTGRSPLCDRPGSPNRDLAEFRSALAAGSLECITGASLGYDEQPEAMRVTVQWKRERCWARSKPGELLLYALPHQIPLFACEEGAQVAILPNGGHRNLRGYNRPVITTNHGSLWVWLVPNLPMPWVSDPDPRRLEALKQAMKADETWDFGGEVLSGMIDSYFGGKELAKMARLILLFDELDGAGQGNVTLRFLHDLKARLHNWFTIKQNPLMYDSVWGGIVSCGCKAKQGLDHTHFDGWHCANDPRKGECTIDDIMAEFGNGHYNDHHFHYGYWIYAAAVVARYDPTFVKAHDGHVLALIRDIANPSPADPYFTPWRHFDWYVGHAWAGGIYPLPEGRNQESTSESINAWYAIALYGEATKNTAVKALGKAQALLETLSAKYYWHVQAAEPIYPKAFTRHMVGILYDSKVTSWTWFGQENWKVHGIQIIPITPMVHHLFSPEFARKEFVIYDRVCQKDPSCANGGFKVFAVAEEAFVNPDAAWEDAQKLPAATFEGTGGGGNSRTNLLYFIASWGRFPHSQWRLPDPRLCPFEREFPWEPQSESHPWRKVAAVVGATAAFALVAWLVARRPRWSAEERRPLAAAPSASYSDEA